MSESKPPAYRGGDDTRVNASTGEVLGTDPPDSDDVAVVATRVRRRRTADGGTRLVNRHRLGPVTAMTETTRNPDHASVNETAGLTAPTIWLTVTPAWPGNTHPALVSLLSTVVMAAIERRHADASSRLVTTSGLPHRIVINDDLEITLNPGRELGIAVTAAMTAAVTELSAGNPPDAPDDCTLATGVDTARWDGQPFAEPHGGATWASQGSAWPDTSAEHDLAEDDCAGLVTVLLVFRAGVLRQVATVYVRAARDLDAWALMRCLGRQLYRAACQDAPWQADTGEDLGERVKAFHYQLAGKGLADQEHRSVTVGPVTVHIGPIGAPSVLPDVKISYRTDPITFEPRLLTRQVRCALEGAAEMLLIHPPYSATIVDRDCRHEDALDAGRNAMPETERPAKRETRST